MIQCIMHLTRRSNSKVVWTVTLLQDGKLKLLAVYYHSNKTINVAIVFQILTNITVSFNFVSLTNIIVTQKAGYSSHNRSISSRKHLDYYYDNLLFQYLLMSAVPPLPSFQVLVVNRKSLYGQST